jgi:hypothetical protein
MKPVLVAGAVVVVLAFVCYTVGILSEQRRRAISASGLRWLVAGVVFDVSATACMMAGATGTWFTPHGWLGYSALAGMATETVMAWRHRRAHGDSVVPARLHLYTRIAYAWWLVAFLSGGALVARRRMGG